MIGRLLLAATTLVTFAALGSGCSEGTPPASAPAPSTTPAAQPREESVPTLPAPAPAPSASARPSAAACQAADGWDCVWQQRFAQVTARVKQSPGQLGVVLRDRQTGAVWQAGQPGQATWTASTIKLAMVAYLLEGSRAGTITLTAADRRDLADMLAWSSDDAADRIWKRGGGAAMVPVFQQRYTMKGLTFVTGFDRYWGFMKCTPADLANLMGYVLSRLHADDRAFVVKAMRTVDDIQHWGVWAAGAAQQAGTKNGWSEEVDGGAEHWVTHTVGFAGPGERYTLAIMYSMPAGQDSLDLGVHTVSDIAAALFGVATPVPVVVRPT
ncbi:hypothetical protein [Longispora albida]|uniref:hypothetical protein n=1 Tax=Longispora albida TaxID=203523 RepID=UPI000360952F|nr:hypothetical protein [Longispora albida]